jgi:hypothetical protein
VSASQRLWDRHELALLASMYPHCHTADVAAWLGRSLRSVYRAADLRGVVKSPEYLASDAAARVQRGHDHPAIRANRLRKGEVPWNKGLRGVNGFSSTRFQRGSMPQTWRPVGSIRIERDGPIVKVTDTRRKKADWRPVREVVWEQANGPIPDGMIVAFRPGMRTNEPALITADKLEIITREELMRRNSVYALYGPEIGGLHQLRGALTRQINKQTRRLHEHQAAH